MSHTATSPLISIVIPVYNSANFLALTLDSVLAQTYRHFELILVNDGSTDHSLEIIQQYQDPRINLISLSKNQGVSNARNTGVAQAQGEYIAFCDADDLYAPERLQTQLDFLLQHPEVDVCGSFFTVLEDGQQRLIEQPQTDEQIKEFFFYNNGIAQPSVMGKANIFKQYPYDTSLVASEDYALWIRMVLSNVVFANVPQPLVQYRIHPAQASQAKAKLLDQTFKRICYQYMLSFLNNPLLNQYHENTQLSLTEFSQFVETLAQSCKGKSINIFRLLIAQQYRKLKHHNVFTLLQLLKLKKRYQIDLPDKYLLNLWILSFTPVKRESKFFETLTKLKV